MGNRDGLFKQNKIFQFNFYKHSQRFPPYLLQLTLFVKLTTNPYLLICHSSRTSTHESPIPFPISSWDGPITNLLPSFCFCSFFFSNLIYKYNVAIFQFIQQNGINRTRFFNNVIHVCNKMSVLSI